MELQGTQGTKQPIDDETIIELYWNRNESAIFETDFKYKKYLLRIAYNILNDESDSEESLNDTYFGVWNAIPPSRPNVFKAFITVIMRRTAIKRYHSKTRKSDIPSEMTVALTELEDIVKDGDDVEAAFDNQKLGRTINEFVRSLSDRKRFIFISRYYEAEPIDAIAKELSLSRSSVNKELASIRADLKAKLESEGYSI